MYKKYNRFKKLKIKIVKKRKEKKKEEERKEKKNKRKPPHNCKSPIRGRGL